MKIDEPFDQSVKSKKAPENLIFRIASGNDCESISELLAERNPLLPLEKIRENTKREVSRTESDVKYKLFVAELNSAVVGVCRFCHSTGMPADKKIYPSPEGWYGMGILVHPKFRRQSIAKFLSVKRLEILRHLGARELYSIVDIRNLASMKMHERFGYIEVERALGFLHLGFDSGTGCLFKFTL